MIFLEKTNVEYQYKYNYYYYLVFLENQYLTFTIATFLTYYFNIFNIEC